MGVIAFALEMAPYRLLESLEDVGRQLVHHSAVVVDELALLVDAEVARVRVAVEVARLEHLRVQS